MNPPQITARQHLRHFMATVEDYENLDATYPLPRSVNLLTHLRSDTEKWVVILHAAVLRKYFNFDKLSLDKVAGWLREVMEEDDADTDWDAMIENVKLLDNNTVYHHGDERLSETDIALRMLNARYLHGDYSKWAIEPPRTYQEPAFLAATMKRSHRLRQLTVFIRLSIEEGLLDLSEEADQ